MLQGMGESIRGNVNTAIDSALNDTTGVARNKAIADKGEREMRTGKFVESGSGSSLMGNGIGSSDRSVKEGGSAGGK